jgi:predicted PurR-regulated permease PerM
MSQNNKEGTIQNNRLGRRIIYTAQYSFIRRTFVVVGIVAAVLLGLWLLWYAAAVFLLIFAGILVGVLLSSLSNVLSKHTPIPYHWSVGIVVLAIFIITGLVVWLWAPRIIHEATQLVDKLPHSLSKIEQQIAQYPWGQELLEWLPPISQIMPSRSNVLARVTDIFSMALNILTSFVVVLFVGLYLAIDPRLYEKGIVKLVPINQRLHAREILQELGYSLRWWLVGRISSMIIIGVLITVGLWLLGMPLALVLGLLAGLLEYIPNIGPILAAVPAVLVAFTQEQSQVLYVVALYLAVQALESYVITPLILKKAVSLPPAVTISVLVFFGVLFGFLGLLLATPLAVVLLVLVKKLYVEDILGDTSASVPGEEKIEQDQSRSG